MTRGIDARPANPAQRPTGARALVRGSQPGRTAATFSWPRPVPDPVPSLVLVGHDASTGPDFEVQDLPGSAGRLDVLVRGLTTALLTSHGVREAWTVDLVLLGPPDPPRRVTVDGAAVRHLNPDERSTALLLQKVLAEPVPGKTPVEAGPGVAVARQGLVDALEARAADGPLFVLDEAGGDVADVELPAEATFVLSDHRDLAADERALLDDAGATALSLGPVPLHVHQAVAVLQNAWDRRHPPDAAPARDG